MCSKTFLQSKLNSAVQEFQQLEQQYTQIQQELLVRQGALKTLQELINKTAEDKVTGDVAEGCASVEQAPAASESEATEGEG